MARLSGGAGGEPEHYFDYVQDSAPSEPIEAETWYDTDDDEAKVYTGAEWQLTNLVDHTNLSNVGAADHHAPIPSGVITMWSGTTSDVPDGWTLCDGSDGTPDLRDRFIVGAGGQYAADDTGGADSVALSESELPSHSHGVTDPGHNHSQTDYTQGGNSGWDPNYDGSGNHSGPNVSTETTGISIDAAGGDSAHENRPPYYAMAFIMKV